MNNIMRTIDFRGKDKDNNWVHGDLIHGVNAKKGNLYILPLEHNLAYIPNCHYLDGVKIENETIGQFTGLKDKNGVEIYEGDIVEHTISGNISVHEVYFDNEMLEFGLRYSGELFHCQFNDEFELIGNIHDNPELLTKNRKEIKLKK